MGRHAWFAGDEKLRAVAARMGMQKAVERSQAYYISQQNAQYACPAVSMLLKALRVLMVLTSLCSGAQEDAKIVALQYEKATDTFGKAQQEQVDIERRMRDELAKNADSMGAMQLSPELQEELNHAAMRVCSACQAHAMRSGYAMHTDVRMGWCVHRLTSAGHT